MPNRQYVSPDGALRFLAVAREGGDVSPGFAGSPWHTHADIPALITGRPR